MVLIFCLRIRMPRLSEGLILHARQHEILWKYIIWTYSWTEEAEFWQSRQSRSAFISLGMKADLKCETTDLQSRQKGSVEAELPIFGNEGRVLVEKPIFRSLAVKIERKCRRETTNLWKSRQRWNAEAELHIFGRPGRTSAESGTSDLCQSRRAEVREQNFTYLAVKAERKCGSETSHFWQSMQNESADVEFQIFGSQCGAEVWKWNFRSLAVKTERKCSQALWQSSQVGRAEADLNSFDRPLSYWLSLPMLKNISTDCYTERQYEDHVWLKHMTSAMRVTKSICFYKGLLVILDWTFS